jgi:hypothetical protein
LHTVTFTVLITYHNIFFSWFTCVAAVLYQVHRGHFASSASWPFRIKCVVAILHQVRRGHFASSASWPFCIKCVAAILHQVHRGHFASSASWPFCIITVWTLSMFLVIFSSKLIFDCFYLLIEFWNEMSEIFCTEKVMFKVFTMVPSCIAGTD